MRIVANRSGTLILLTPSSFTASASRSASDTCQSRPACCAASCADVAVTAEPAILADILRVVVIVFPFVCWLVGREYLICGCRSQQLPGRVGHGNDPLVCGARLFQTRTPTMLRMGDAGIRGRGIGLSIHRL